MGRIEEMCYSARMIFLLLILLPVSVFAEPENGPEKLPQKMLFVGNAIEDKLSGDLLQLICAGESTEPAEPSIETQCSQLRFIHVDGTTKQMTLVGPMLHVSQDEAKAEKSVLKKVKWIAKKWRKYERYWRDPSLGRVLIGVGGTMVVVSGLCIATIATGGSLLLGFSIVGSGFGAAFVAGGAKDPLSFQHVHKVEKLANENDWNWSLKTNKLSEKKYKLFYDFINEKLPISETAQQNHWED